MPLPSGSDLKELLRIEHDAEDSLLDDLVEQATAHAESLINRPIKAEERTYSGLRGIYDSYGRSVMYLPDAPVSLAPAIEIANTDGDVVDDAEYLVDASGRITSTTGFSFGSHPYEITAMTGLEVATDYATKYEPMLRTLILGIASIFYKQRNPNVTSDSSGGGVSVSYASNADTDGLPPHLYSIVRRLRPVRIH